MQYNTINDKREGDYNTITDFILDKLNTEYKQSNILTTEIERCTKILRFALKNRMKSPYDALIVDGIWKLMLLNIERVLEKEDKVQSDCMEELKRNVTNNQKKIKETIERLKIREKEIELEYMIKKEEYEAKINSLTIDKNKLNEILEANKLLIQDLTDTSRFMHIHYFLTEFEYKFESTYDGHLNKLKLTRNMLQLLIKEDNLMKELNEELSTKEILFPKHVIGILRKLQTQLDIRTSELRGILGKINLRIKKVLSGAYDTREVVNAMVQTKPLPGFKNKVLILYNSIS